MDSLRIKEKNIVLSRIKDIENYIKRNEETITRFKKQSNLGAFEVKQIEKLSLANKNYEIELVELNKKVTCIVTGKLDHELEKLIIASKKNKIKDDEKQQHKIIEKDKKDKSDKKYITQSYKINGNRNDDFFMDKEYDRYIKLCNSIPEYIERNLKEMPLNKGYIWKGLWCLGKLPKENTDQVIMFEKSYNGILRIHEIDNDYTRIYEKKGKEKKILISELARSNFIKEYRKKMGY